MKGTLIGGLIALLAAIIGSVAGALGTYLVQRDLDQGANEASARGVARVAGENLRRDLVELSEGRATLQQLAKHPPDGEIIFYGRNYLGLTRHLRKEVVPPEMSTADRKLIAVQLNSADWQAVAAVNAAIARLRSQLAAAQQELRQARHVGSHSDQLQQIRLGHIILTRAITETAQPPLQAAAKALAKLAEDD